MVKALFKAEVLRTALYFILWILWRCWYSHLKLWMVFEGQGLVEYCYGVGQIDSWASKALALATIFSFQKRCAVKSWQTLSTSSLRRDLLPAEVLTCLRLGDLARCKQFNWLFCVVIAFDLLLLPGSRWPTYEVTFVDLWPNTLNFKVWSLWFKCCGLAVSTLAMVL